MHASVSSPVLKKVLKHVQRTTPSSFLKRQLYATAYCTFPVLFCHGHGGVISPPKKVQRYDDGYAPEVQSTQPVEQLLHFSCIILSWAWWSYRSSEVAEMHAIVSSPVSKKVLKHVQRTTDRPPQVHSQKGNFMLLHTALFLYYSLTAKGSYWSSKKYKHMTMVIHQKCKVHSLFCMQKCMQVYLVLSQKTF